MSGVCWYTTEASGLDSLGGALCETEKIWPLGALFASVLLNNGPSLCGNPNFLCSKFRHGCQLSFDTPWSLVGQVVLAQELI